MHDLHKNDLIVKDDNKRRANDLPKNAIDAAEEEE